MIEKEQKPNLGETAIFHLDNGVPLYVRENRRSPMVNIQAWVRTGSVHEGDFLGHGLSHFLEHMMFQGSGKYSAKRILDVVHSNGGEMNAYTSFDSTVYYLDLLSDAAGEAFDMLADVVANPLFPSKSFKTEKGVILREKAMGLDDPDSVLGDRLRGSVYTIHPVRVPIIGESDLIEVVDRKMMMEYFERRYAVERIFFVVVGDIAPAEAAERLNRAFGGFTRSCPSEPYLPEEPPRRFQLFNRLHFDDPLARLALGYKTPEADAPEIPALDILSSVLGHTKSSRLVRRLRDERGLALNVDAYNYSASFGGIFTVYAACRPDNAEELRSALFGEIAEVAENLAEDELERVRKQAVASVYRGLRSNSGIARMLGDSIDYHGDPGFVSKYLDALSAVDVASVRSVAVDLLDSESAAVIEMSPIEAPTTVSVVAPATSNSAAEGPGLTAVPEYPRLVTLRDTSSPLVDIVLVMPGGTILEGFEKAGMTRLSAALFKAGTKRFDERSLARLLDDNAIFLSVGGGNNSIVFRVNCLRNALGSAVEALRSILSEPLFPEAQFERERGIALESLKTRGMSPQRAAEDALCRLMFGNHPYANPAAGLEESLASMKPEDIHDYYRKVMLNRARTVVGISGPLDRSEALALMEDITGPAPWCDSEPSAEISTPRFPNNPKSAEIALPKEQSVVMLAVPGCSNTHSDRFALDAFQMALNGLETRLFKSIRGDAGLAYYAGLFSSRGLHPGFIAFYAGTAPESVEKVLSIMKREKAKLVSGGLTRKELQDAVSRLRGDSASQRMNSGRMVFECALSEYYGNPHDEPWRRDEVYGALSGKKVDSAISKYLSRKGVVTVVAGPR